LEIKVGRPNPSIDEIEALYRQHGAALLVFACAILGDRARAQDAIHHVFLKLIETGCLNRAEDKKAYLFACVRNAVLNDANFEKRNIPIETDSIWFSPQDRDYAAEHNLRRALHALPADQREVIVLHLWGELTFSQIGQLLNASSNTVASRYRYALGKLRESMSPKENYCAGSR
jgi:RNA polymerase sigma-70 factor, ECF subfamily